MKRLGLALTALLLLALTACDVTMITSPLPGTITDESTITVTGTLPGSVPTGGTIDVNGVAGSFSGERDWEADIPASPVGYVTVVLATYTAPDGREYTQQTAVVNGPHVDDGAYSPDGVGMRFTNAGLAGLGPVISDLAGGAFDISGLILSQDPLLPPSDVALGHSMTGRAYEGGAESVTVGASSTATGVSTPITVRNLYLGLDLQLSGPILNGPCKLELQIPTTSIAARFDLRPAPGDASHVDVNMVGTPAVTLTGVTYEFISGICDPSTFLLGSIINSLAGDLIEEEIASGFQTQLGDPDGSGPADSPVADAIETALAQISIAGSVGDAVQARLDAPFTQINETAGAIDMRADADFQATFGTGPGQCVQAAGAPDLTSSFHVPGAYPTLGGTTPSGQPYGLGLVISTSAFNQLLSSMTECGLLNQELHEIDLGGTVVPVTPAVLSVLVPQFANLSPTADVFIRVDPQFAPFLTDAPDGPGGATAEMRLADLRISFVQDTFHGSTPVQVDLLTLGVEAPLGLSMAFDPVAGQLAPTITPPAGSEVTTRVVTNAIGADEATTEAVFSSLFPNFVSGLSSSFGAFPLPSFLGLDLSVSEIARQGEAFVLYADLDPAPQTRIANVAFTDLSTGDSVKDVVTDVAEWRHRVRKRVAADGVSLDLEGMVGADACCTTDSESLSASAGGRVTFDVVPAAGDTWRIDLAHSIAGAHTIKGDGTGGGDRARGSITTVTGRARIGSGAWQTFSFNPSSLSSGWVSPSSSSSAYQYPFTGSGATALTGTTAQTITVEYSFGVTAESDNEFWAALQGPEAAVRFGVNDTITNGFTAGEYPGVGNRNIATDGYRLQVALTTA